MKSKVFIIGFFVIFLLTVIFFQRFGLNGQITAEDNTIDSSLSLQNENFGSVLKVTTLQIPESIFIVLIFVVFACAEHTLFTKRHISLQLPLWLMYLPPPVKA